MARTLAEKRIELMSSKEALRKEGNAILTKDGDLDENDKSRFDEIERCVKDHDERIEKIESHMHVESEDGEPLDQEMSFGLTQTKKFDFNSRKSPILTEFNRPKGEAKGTAFVRYFMGSHIAKTQGWNGAAHWAETLLGDSAIAKAMSTGAQAAGGALMPQDFIMEMIELMRANVVMRKAGAQILPLPYGNGTYSRLNGASTAYWVAENNAMTTSQASFDDLQFTTKKLTAQSVVSGQLLRQSPLSVEGIVRRDLVAQMQRAEDITFLTSSGSSTQPTGLTSLALAANLLSVTGSFTLALANNTLLSLELALINNNIPVDKAGWIFHPSVRSALSTLTDSTGRYFFKEELDRGMLLGYPYYTTTQLPTNLGGGTNETQVFFVAFDQCIIADTLNLMLDSSADGTYVSGGVDVGAFPRDQVIFRAISQVDFNIQHPAAVAVATCTGWAPSFFTTAAGSAFSTQPANTTPSSAGSANPQ